MRARNLQNHVILVRTHYNEITAHTHRWSEQIRQLFDESWQVTDIEAEEATHEHVEKALRAAEPGAVFLFYGQGAPNHLKGQDENPACDLQSAPLLANCKVYTVACRSAAELGKAVEKHGGPVYFGYAKAIRGYWQENNEHAEEMMDTLGECVNAGMRIWLAQPTLTARQIEREMKDAYDRAIAYCNKHFLEKPAPDIKPKEAVDFAKMLLRNQRFLKRLGDENMCLTCPVS